MKDLERLVAVDQIRALMARYARYAYVDSRVEAFLNGPTRSWFNPVYVKAHRKGGHFVPWENPDAAVDDIRATFRRLR